MTKRLSTYPHNTPAQIAGARRAWFALDNEQRRRFIKRFGVKRIAAVIGNDYDERRGAQHPPPGDWAIWALLAGRGFGKTMAGAAWVQSLANIEGQPHRFALIGANLDAARAIMVEGESGLLAQAVECEPPKFNASLRRLKWPNGSQATLYSGGEADSLRGPQFHYAWGDEVAHWPDGEAALTNLRMGVRLGEQPRIMLTTTPRPHGWLKALLAEPGVVLTRGKTADNAANLSGVFIDAMQRRYGGTAIGRQELDGEMVEDLDGALWTRALLDGCRVAAVDAGAVRAGDAGMSRVVIGVDPPAGSGTCGIVVAGLCGRRAVVLDDASVSGVGPNGWARAVVRAADRWGADRVVAEVNNGGDMVINVLRSVDFALPVVKAHASRGKVARAEPVASLYREGRVAHAGAFVALEDELCGLLESGVYAGPGGSPDRADALVWAVSELLLGERKGGPSVRGF